jgi:hypothetical protein
MKDLPFHSPSIFLHISLHTFHSPSTFLHISLHTLSEAMEDFNIPGAERVALLERLQEAMGDGPPYFWAACQICDLKALEKLVEHARIYPEMARIFAGQTYKMIIHCK